MMCVFLCLILNSQFLNPVLRTIIMLNLRSSV